MPGLNMQATLPVPEFVPININIIYSMQNPVDGIQFVISMDAYPYCTWDFEFVIPRYLEQQESAPEDDGELLEGDNSTIVVCSGELVEQVAHSCNSSKTIFMFSQNTSTSVQHIAFAAGPFHVHSISADLSATEDVSGTSQPLMHVFYFPGHESLLGTFVSFMRSAMSFYSTEFRSYPFGLHKLIFVDEMLTQWFDSATLSLITVDLLQGKDAIDQVLKIRHCLSHALACQWIGINIQQKTWSDTWLMNRLGLYITGLFIWKLMRNHEYRFRLKKDMECMLELDNGFMSPICQPQLFEPPDPVTLAFINLKSPLILHILDRHLGKSGTSLELSRVLLKVFLSAISGELPNNTLSTHLFLRTCRKVSGIDPHSFAEQWIYGSGCPMFGFSATFNCKKMVVEISMHQEAPAFKVHENNEVTKVLMKPAAVLFFEGQMTIHIHEADGMPYEHILNIRSSYKCYEVPFNTKYKRVRQNTKQYLACQAAAQATAEGDAEAVAAMNMVNMGFVTDWTEEDEQNMAGQMYEWIRINTGFEWIAAIAFDQKDYMWVSQLQRDRDVGAQYEAIQVLLKTPNAMISSTFAKTVLVSNYYFQIHCEAS
ncbi:zincin [Laetiporus sulphureus 93-53]|uniref:Transcription initiation factor TFIID subunit 2 n=1 Tax=Laetiporus sulphureus 93-53 TaxID=1314785 RepID=A0A165D386_9APHY|nr:zincin [Laetiporus sulphureus 93-53]KZT04071.1 zincin [Laetiporus sulphureus 93-53]